MSIKEGLEMQHKPETIVVTGGAGFIGSNFLLYMVPRYPDVQFINVDNLSYAGNLTNLESIRHLANYRFVEADITDREAMSSLVEDSGCTTIVHFAAESHVDRSILDPLVFVRTNTVGTVVLLEAARQVWGKRDGSFGRNRFYHISTDEVFGSLGEHGYFNDQTPYDPRSPYSASKASSDFFVRAYGHTYGLPVIISNCTNNYGPYQFPEKLIPLTITRAIQEDTVPVYGKGENVRDWLYVVDHCEAIDQILHYGKTGSIYLIGGQAEHKNLDVVRLILDEVDRALGRPEGVSRNLIRFVTDRPGHDFRYAMDISRIRDELGWQPSHSLEEGLRLTVEWYLAHSDWINAVRDSSYRTYFERQYAERLEPSGS